MAATADFYGARVSTFRPGGGPPSLELVAQIPGRLNGPEFLWRHQRIGVAAEAPQAALAAHPEAGHRLLIAPGAGHGYMCSARGDFHPQTAAAGWAALLELFASSL